MCTLRFGSHVFADVSSLPHTRFALLAFCTAGLQAQLADTKAELERTTLELERVKGIGSFDVSEFMQVCAECWVTATAVRSRPCPELFLFLLFGHTSLCLSSSPRNILLLSSAPCCHANCCAAGPLTATV